MSNGEDTTMPTETTLNEPLRSGRLFGRERWMVYHPDADTYAPVFKTRKEARENCTRWNRLSCTGHIVIDLEKRPNIQLGRAERRP